MPRVQMSRRPLREGVGGAAVVSPAVARSCGHLKGCVISSLDRSISRVIQLGREREIPLRLDTFNAFNQAGIIDRNTTMNLADTTPGAATTITNLPSDANGNLMPALSLPRNAGVGVATSYQVRRTVPRRFNFRSRQDTVVHRRRAPASKRSAIM